MCSDSETKQSDWKLSSFSQTFQSDLLRNFGPIKPTPLVTVLQIRIRMILGLPAPDPLVRGTDSAPDPSIIMQSK